MKIQLFNNRTGLIHGRDLKRINSEVDGVLKIGNTDINVFADGESIFPLLFNGATGDYVATFTDCNGVCYSLDKVRVRHGRIIPPTPIMVELMELKCRAETSEAAIEALQKEVISLGKIFDTNSLNFIIGGEENK